MSNILKVPLPILDCQGLKYNPNKITEIEEESTEFVEENYERTYTYFEQQTSNVSLEFDDTTTTTPTKSKNTNEDFRLVRVLIKDGVKRTLKMKKWDLQDDLKFSEDEEAESKVQEENPTPVKTPRKKRLSRRRRIQDTFEEETLEKSENEMTDQVTIKKAKPGQQRQDEEKMEESDAGEFLELCEEAGIVDK